jgi:hypothetical protein
MDHGRNPSCRVDVTDEKHPLEPVVIQVFPADEPLHADRPRQTQSRLPHISIHETNTDPGLKEFCCKIAHKGRFPRVGRTENDGAASSLQQFITKIFPSGSRDNLHAEL